MTTLRKARVNCPKCGHGFTVRDNGGLTKEQADRVWAAFDLAFDAMDRAIKTGACQRQRAGTPIPFRDLLLSIAASASMRRAA